MSNKRVIKKNEYISTNCSYNIVFCTKYRRKLLDELVATRLKELIIETSKEVEFSIEHIEIELDYVKLKISCDPSIGVLKCLREIKGNSSKILREEFASIRRRVPSIWTRYAYIRTSDKDSLADMEDFLNHQKEH